MANLRAVIIFGPPGSGKGTQSRLIAEKTGYEEFDTGKLIEKVINDPELQDDVIIRREKKNFYDGRLCTTEWVAGIVKKHIKEIYQSGKGVIFSGSPRTLYEAKELIPYLEQLYGKENICIIQISITAEESIFRNSHRRVCKRCGYSLVYNAENEKLTNCPQCGGELVKRGDLDKPETIKVRLEEYENRTVPIYRFIEERGIKIHDVEGKDSVEEVAQKFSQILGI